MTFGGKWEVIGSLQQKDADTLVDRSIDAGINFFDTADVYSFGDSEEILGKSLAAKRQDVVIATKVRGRMGPGANDVGLSRLHIIRSVEASLKRLGTDYIDLYQIHRSDNETDIEETLTAMTNLVRSGKVRYIGCSNLPAWELMRALGVSRQRGPRVVQDDTVVLCACGTGPRTGDDPAPERRGAGAAGLESTQPGDFLSGKFSREGATDPKARRASFKFPPVDEAKGIRHHRRHPANR